MLAARRYLDLFLLLLALRACTAKQGPGRSANGTFLPRYYSMDFETFLTQGRKGICAKLRFFEHLAGSHAKNAQWSVGPYACLARELVGELQCENSL